MAQQGDESTTPLTVPIGCQKPHCVCKELMSGLQRMVSEAQQQPQHPAALVQQRLPSGLIALLETLLEQEHVAEAAQVADAYHQ